MIFFFFLLKIKLTTSLCKNWVGSGEDCSIIYTYAANSENSMGIILEGLIKLWFEVLLIQIFLTNMLTIRPIFSTLAIDLCWFYFNGPKWYLCITTPIITYLKCCWIKRARGVVNQFNAHLMLLQPVTEYDSFVHPTQKIKSPDVIISLYPRW